MKFLMLFTIAFPLTIILYENINRTYLQQQQPQARSHVHQKSTPKKNYKVNTPFTLPPNQPLPLIYVQGGSFDMGSTGLDEGPIHHVRLSSFYISKYEVTEAQWKAVTGEKIPQYSKEDCDSCAVEASYHETEDFLLKLKHQTGQNYRFPTEAEWEYAARGGNQSKGYTYSGSDILDEVGYDDDERDFMRKGKPVGHKKPNELGIYDMSGNLAEWCSDLYDEQYYSYSPVDNPKGSYRETVEVDNNGRHLLIVIRGGSRRTTGRNAASYDLQRNVDPIGIRVIVGQKKTLGVSVY